MSDIPPELLYAESHEWIRREGDEVVIGITDYAQQSLGDITFVQLPKRGAPLAAGSVFGVIESVKAASDLYAPVSGTVVAPNEALNAAPETVNRSPYAEGWLLRVKRDDEGVRLLSAVEYRRITG